MAGMLNIGFGNFVAIDRLVAIMTPDSAQIKRMVAHSKENKKFLDGSHGRRTRSVIVLEDGYTIYSGLTPQTLCERAAKTNLTVTKERDYKDDEEGAVDSDIGGKRNG